MFQRFMIIVSGLAFVYGALAVERPLETRYPELKESLKRLDLIPATTPLEHWEALEKHLIGLGYSQELQDKIWIKRDDLSHQLLGGNKARKLEYILASARNQGQHTLVTFGAWGSNHAYATTLAASQQGLKVELHLGPQPVSENVRKKLLADYALGADMHFHSTRLGLGLAIVKNLIRSKINKDVQYVPPGGSNPIGTLGYVDAMLEFMQQLQELKRPLPQEIILPMGTAGTTAGLMVGACLAGVLDQTRFVAVGISHDALSNEQLVRKTARKTHEFLKRQLTRQHRRQLPQCNYNKTSALEYVNYTNPRYGEATQATQAAIVMAKKKLNLVLDGTYSGKAFAYMLERLEGERLQGLTPRTRLFWMTYNSHSLDELIESHSWRDPSRPWLDLPEAFHRLF